MISLDHVSLIQLTGAAAAHPLLDNLRQPESAVTLRYRSLSEFIAYFLRQYPGGFYGQKFVGKATARATHGKWYPLLFNGKERAFRSWYFNDSPSAQRTEAEAKAWWSTFKLESKYELLAGGLAGESVACHGDSGGPLLRGTTAPTLTTYGVSFAVEGTISSACGLGGGYAVFNSSMLAFVKGAIAPKPPKK